MSIFPGKAEQKKWVEDHIALAVDSGFSHVIWLPEGFRAFWGSWMDEHGLRVQIDFYFCCSNQYAAMCFKDEAKAVLFKLRWIG